VKISVCIPATRHDTLGATAASITRQTWSDWEALLVTQRPTPEMSAVVERLCADDRFREVRLERRGLSIARNAGTLAADGEIVAMIDDDAEARDDWIEVMAGCFAADRSVGLVGGAVVAPPGQRGNCPTNHPPEVLYRPEPGRPAPPGWDWIGCNFAYRRDTFDQFGPFDEHIGGGTPYPSHDDTDFKLRLERHGVPMLATPRAVVQHTYGVRSGFRNRLHHQRNYSCGSGGMAAKLTLQGDPRGEEWEAQTKRECTTGWLHNGRIDRFPFELRRWRLFESAYRSCLTTFEIDASGELLQPRAASSSSASNLAPERDHE
jgi:glycosyltransferase involved in cell wall biosynthesis